MLRGIGVGGIHQDVGIDNKHLALSLHRRVESLAIGYIY
jgi:hypothetical protein